MNARGYEHDDRVRQLQEIAALCEALANELAAHRDATAPSLAATAQTARALLDQGFDQSDLTALARQFPDPPEWLNPKALDAGLPIEDWQVALAPSWTRASALALELRTLATY